MVRNPRRLLEVVLACQAVALIGSVLLGYFRGYPTISSLVGRADDGWCNPLQGEGIGVHCFGDFGHSLYNSRQDSPWADSRYSNPYPPSVLVVFRAFDYMARLFGYNVSLFGYLTFLIFALWLTSMLLSRRDTSLEPATTALFGTSIMLSWPIILAFSRGNSVLIITPVLVLLFFGGTSRIRTSLLMFFVACVKPQFLLLFAILGFGRLIFLSIIFAFLQFGATLLLVGGRGAFTAYSDWIRNMIAFDEYASSSTTISYQHFFARLLQLFEVDVAGWTWFKPGLLVAILTLLAILKARGLLRHSEQMQTLALASACLGATFVSDTVFGYYAVIPLISAWMAFLSLYRLNPPLMPPRRLRRFQTATVAVILFSSITFVLPPRETTFSYFIITGPVLVFHFASLGALVSARDVQKSLLPADRILQ